MQRANVQHDELIELGTARTETKGPLGDPIDELQGFAVLGLSED